MSNSILVWSAPGAGPIELSRIKDEFKKLKAERDEVIVVGTALESIEINRNSVLSMCNVDGSPIQQEELNKIKDEIKKAWEDPSLTVVVPCRVRCFLL